MKYKISVIIPIFNAEKYLKECLDSLINQSLGIENIEVILVDDCSSDSSLEIAKSFAEKYSSISLLEQSTNQGPGAARNLGLKHVHSDFVTYLDSDDYIDDNTYEYSLSKMISEDCDLFIFKSQLFEEPNNELKFCSQGECNLELNNDSNNLPTDIHQEIYKKSQLIEDITKVPEIIFSTSPWNKIYSKKLFKYLNFPSMLYEDNIVTTLAIFNSNKIYVGTDCIYYYRQHEIDKTRTNTITKRHLHDLSLVVGQILATSLDYPEYEALSNFLSLKFINDVLIWAKCLDFQYSDLNEVLNLLKENMKLFSNKYIDIFNETFPNHEINKEEILDLENMEIIHFLIKYRYFNILINPEYESYLFVDTGNNFNSLESISKYYKLREINTIRFDLSDYNSKDIKKLRFDPIESRFCSCRIHEIKSNLDKEDLAISKFNSSLGQGFGFDSHYSDFKDSEIQIFDSDDPQYIIEGDLSKISYIEISFSLRILSHSEICDIFGDALFNNKNLANEVEGLNRRISDYDAVVKNREEIIKGKDEIIDDKDLAIADKDKIILNQKEIIEELSNSLLNRLSNYFHKKMD